MPASVNPARAGMIPMAEKASFIVMRKPRTRGDDPGESGDEDGGES